MWGGRGGHPPTAKMTLLDHQPCAGPSLLRTFLSASPELGSDLLRSVSLVPQDWRTLSSRASRAPSAYQSPAYQAARKVLGDAAVRDIRIVEAVE